ncbi:MAG: adenosylmethionine--8-amino-7-oxononanoate transaminase [Blastocatellia bacterium]|nr:adenosylmethionine--8-amino-7-oxononanoate transaminase [Blastocatellia bacterium]
MTHFAPEPAKQTVTPAERLEQLDKAHLWHPFTQMKEWHAVKPLIIERAEGCYLFDVEGNRYLDGVSSLWVTVHGHQTREIDEAIREQLGKVAHSTLLGLSNVPAIELAVKLAELAPGNLNKVFYSDSGSTAVEIALKIAFQYWQQRPAPRRTKTRFLHLAESYHGDTIGSVSVGGIDLFHQLYRPLLFDAFRAPVPRTLADADAVEAIFQNHADEIAAFVMEPVMMGAAGMLAHPPGYLARVRELCTAYDVLLICDEVATGFGRTGTLFACESENVTPDLLCLAKGLTGGYLPLAATIATDELYRAFWDDYSAFKTFFHGHTYTGNPLACVAALANLKLFETNELLQHVERMAGHLSHRLAEISALPHVGDIRQRGLMAGIELTADKTAGTAYPVEWKMGYQVTDRCRAFGLILRPLGNVVVVMPPLAISAEQIDFLVDTLKKVIVEVTEKSNR